MSECRADTEGDGERTDLSGIHAPILREGRALSENQDIKSDESCHRGVRQEGGGNVDKRVKRSKVSNPHWRKGLQNGGTPSASSQGDVKSR